LPLGLARLRRRSPRRRQRQPKIASKRLPPHWQAAFPPLHLGQAPLKRGPTVFSHRPVGYSLPPARTSNPH